MWCIRFGVGLERRLGKGGMRRLLVPQIQRRHVPDIRDTTCWLLAGLAQQR